MSVYIPGMEMPTSCFKCKMSSITTGQWAWCRLTGDCYPPDDPPPAVCPLVPVPPHGRLIDTDAVSLEGGPYEYDEWCKWALDQYQDAPTIIPSDGKDTDVPTREEVGDP